MRIIDNNKPKTGRTVVEDEVSYFVVWGVDGCGKVLKEDCAGPYSKGKTPKTLSKNYPYTLVKE